MFEPSKASTAQFDIREDEEQYAKMAEILDLLVSAGYFRAKIQGLSAFDKIVGGMVWCISLCAESVDVDLLYSENSTIGQKISLTENIVKVLPKFKCPHALEPHQIQGLDCIHILPVMKWLVKEAIEAKIRTGDEILNHAAFQFRQEGWKLPPSYENDGIPLGTVAPKPKRIYRRAERMDSLDISEDVKCTLMEYGHEASDVVVLPEVDEGEEKKKEREKLLQRDLQIAEKLKSELEEAVEISTTKGRMSARVVNDLIDSSTLDGVEEEESGKGGVQEIDQMRTELERLKNEKKNLKEELAEEEMKFEKITVEAAELKENYEAQQALFKHVDSSTVEKLKSIFEEVIQAKQKYREYKRSCRAAIEDLENDLSALEAADEGDSIIIDDAINAEHESLASELQKIDSELNESNRELFQLRCQIDANPSQLEKNQYQKRFVELYNHLSSKHREIKGLYTLHNMKVDIRNFIKKEIDLLNNIDDLKDKAVKDSYKTSFVQNLEQILKSIEVSLEKMSTRQETLKKEKDGLYDEVQLSVDKQRIYNSAVADFQTVCYFDL
uniref:Coiled-coil domain-containing protein 93 n=1 Tax=Panagrolaimus sp. PS1159 TaxID=55785 RepID=A0AC35FK69_9BILA